jgi:1-acyl-sn-glycerol-3-phosphate acyltransferase
VEIGLVPFGSLGLPLFGLDLAFASPAPPAASQPLAGLALLALPSPLRVLFDLFAVGLFGGFFIVPLYALVQIRSQASHRARIIAANNIINALFMAVGALAAAGLLSLGLSIPALFGAAALCNAAVAIYIYRLVPEFLIRFIVWLLVHSLYRLEKRGMDAIPDEGPALLVCNHLSYVDSLVITAACRRPIRFVLDRRFFGMPVLSYLLKRGRAIPIAAEEGHPAPDERALAEISAALAAGQLVAVFPEGDISADGEMRAFLPWIDRILADGKAPVVPLALIGLWGSVFSRRDGAVPQRLAKLRLFQKIVIAAGAPLEAGTTDSIALAEAVRALRGEA